MSFATDLLDGFDLLYKRTEGVMKNCTEISSFYKALARCEKDYAKSLGKLAASQNMDFKKNPPIQKDVGTTADAWDIILMELEKMADYHNQLSEKLENDLSKAILLYIKEKQKSKKKLETDGKRIIQDMKNAQENLQKARAKYVQLSKDADSADTIHTKGKGDMSMKPSALAKLAAKAAQSTDKAAAADNDYQATLHATNQKQQEYYITTMPALLSEFQQFEEDRIQNMKQIVEKFASFYTELPSQYSTSADVITKAANSINVQQDIKAYVNENRTGMTVPQDVQYTPYSEAPAVPRPKQKPRAAPGKIGNYNPTSNDPLADKEWGLSASDQSSSVDVKRNKLTTQLEQLEKLINSETKAKEGLENLVRFYASDPVAQKKAEDQMAESTDKLNKLRDTKNMLQSNLESLANSAGPVRARGLYDYTATCDTELSFRQGDILTITEQDDSGWWYAELRGKAGFVPNNYVEPC